MPGVGKGQVAAGRTGAGAEGASVVAGAATGLAATAGFFAAAFLAAGFLAAAFFAAGLAFFFAATISTSLVVKVNKKKQLYYYTPSTPRSGMSEVRATKAAEAASVHSWTYDVAPDIVKERRIE